MRPKTSSPSNTWPSTSREGKRARTPSALLSKPPPGTMTSSPNSSPHDSFTRFPWPRLSHQVAGVLLAGGDDERRLARLGGDEHAHGVAEAAHRVQVVEGGATRGERPAVNHADRNRFLEPEDVSNIRRVDERVHERNFRRAGIAERHGSRPRRERCRGLRRERAGSWGLHSNCAREHYRSKRACTEFALCSLRVIA